MRKVSDRPKWEERQEERGLVVNSSEGLDVFRPSVDFSRICQRRNFLRNISCVLFAWWTSIVRGLHYPMGRQEVNMTYLFDKHRPRVQTWARNNAYTLIFITIMFIFTWIVILIGTAVQLAHIN